MLQDIAKSYDQSSFSRTLENLKFRALAISCTRSKTRYNTVKSVGKIFDEARYVNLWRTNFVVKTYIKCFSIRLVTRFPILKAMLS